MKKETEKKVVNTKEEKKKELDCFIKKHVLKKIKILSIIGIIIFVLIISVFAFASENVNSDMEIVEKTSLINSIKERAIVLLLILFAGWVPYFYIPAITFGAYIFMLAGDVVVAMGMHGKLISLMLNVLPVLIDIFTTSIITAIGIYMTSYTTKKYRYTQRTSFSFIDVKIQLCQMRKKQDKYDELIAKKQEKIDKMKENDVKIDYTNIFRIAPMVMIVNLVACLIEYLINN